MVEDTPQLQYKTPCYQLTRQIIVLMITIFTLMLTILVQSCISILNDKFDNFKDILDQMNNVIK